MTRASFGIVLAIVLITSGQAVRYGPFEGDNLYILQWADATPASDLLKGDPAIYPEWRPLSWATVWLQYRWAGIDQLPQYFAVNLLLWASCGWLVYLIVLRLTSSIPSALVAAAIVVTSSESVGTLALIVDRQISLACLFGLLAWLMVVRSGDEPTGATPLLICLALLASALSKEYGLAFAVGIAVHAGLSRRRHLVLAASAAVVGYAAMRTGFADGALGRYCEDHGFFLVARNVCFDRFDSTTVTQAAYNVAATGVTSLVPGLFATSGEIALAPRLVMLSALLLAFALIGWVHGPPAARTGVFIVLANALQSFMLFRARNHLPAVCALGVAIGCGLPLVYATLGQVATRPAVRAAAAVFLGLLSWRAAVTHELMNLRMEDSLYANPCAPGVPEPDQEFLEQIWDVYNIPLKECDQANEES